MTLDQKLQLWNVVGTWVAGMATFAAVVVSLWLAGRSERIHLFVRVGIRSIFAGDGSPPVQALSFEVTNRGQRPVTVVSIGWTVGKGKQAKFCVQTTSAPYTAHCPVELSHGKSANFLVSFEATPGWAEEFSMKFLPDKTPRTLRTLLALIHTSVGTTVRVKPEENVLKLLRGNVEA